MVTSRSKTYNKYCHSKQKDNKPGLEPTKPVQCGAVIVASNKLSYLQNESMVLPTTTIFCNFVKSTMLVEIMKFLQCINLKILKYFNFNMDTTAVNSK